MNARILTALEELFTTAAKLTTRTAHGLWQHGTGKCAVNATKNMQLKIQNVEYSYAALSKADQEAVDEAVEYAVRFAYTYAQRHEEAASRRHDSREIQQLLQSHLDEITQAAKQTLYSRLRSHTYDHYMGKLDRKAIFQDEDVLKQMVLSSIQVVVGDIKTQSSHSNFRA